MDIVTPFHGRVNRLPKEMQEEAVDMKHGTPAHKELMKLIKTELDGTEKAKFCCYTGKCDTCKVGCGSDKREDPCSIDWDEIVDDALGESRDFISYYRQGWVKAMLNDEDIICESYERLAAHMLNEQDEDELEGDTEEAGDEFVEDDETLPPEDEEGADIPVPEDKEYVGTSDDTHFYMVPEKNDQGEIIDMKIVDQEENQLFSAEENGIEPTDMSLFLNTVFRDSDVGISEIDRQVIVKYIIPAAEQELVDDADAEEEDLGGEEDLLAGGAEDEFGEEEAPEGEGEFEEEEDVGDEEMDKPKKKKDELLRPMESKLTEKRVEFDGHEFDVQLVDEGADATTISVNGREFRFSSSFASLFHEGGELTESGVEELAKDALSNLGQDEFEALAEAATGTKVTESTQFDDPTREEMLAALKSFMDEEGADFDAEAAMYWYASDYHSGQNSNLYSVLSTSEFSPGQTHSSVEDEGDMAEMMYKELESQFGGEGSEEDEEEHQDEPEEYDIFLSPAGSLGGQTQVKAGGKVIGTFNDEDEARQAAREWMEDNKFWPPVWVVSDHGNYHEISLGREDEMDTKESKVEEQGEFKHVYLVKYLKDDGEEAEMRVEALDDNDAKMMMLKRRGVDKVTDVKKVAESKEVEESEEVDEALSRKYYIKFAEMVKNMEDRAAASTLAKTMAAMFKEDNPRFDSSRFMAAADVVMESEVEEAEVEEEVADEKCKAEVEEEVEESEVEESEVEESEVEESDGYDKARDKMVGDAAKATEEFSEDELEAYADKMKKRDAEKASKAEESVEVVEESNPMDEAIDPAFDLAQDLLGLNESVDTGDEIKEGTHVTIMSTRDMQVIYECVKVAQVTEKAVEVTGNEAEVDQEWYSFDTCQIYPV